MLGIIYFTNSLDRANLGNTKTDGIENDLSMTKNQYSLVLILFYIPYGTMNIPATVLAKRFNPTRVIPLLMFGWGVISICTAAVDNFGGLAAARIWLGVVEAGFVSSLSEKKKKKKNASLLSRLELIYGELVFIGHLLLNNVLYTA